jgi:hypothetical protein
MCKIPVLPVVACGGETLREQHRLMVLRRGEVTGGRREEDNDESFELYSSEHVRKSILKIS